MEKRIMGPSQDEYCRGCILNVACNVILKDGESCGDSFFPAPGSLLNTEKGKRIFNKLRKNADLKRKWQIEENKREALGDTVPRGDKA